MAAVLTRHPHIVETRPPSRVAPARDGSGSPRSATQYRIVGARNAAPKASDDPEARLRRNEARNRLWQELVSRYQEPPLGERLRFAKLPR